MEFNTQSMATPESANTGHPHGGKARQPKDHDQDLHGQGKDHVLAAMAPVFFAMRMDSGMASMLEVM